MYSAPLKDLQFVLEQQLQASQLAQYPRHADYSPDLVVSILAEAARFASEILEPLNRSGDQAGAQWDASGAVRMPAGYREAYQRFVADGWPQLGIDTEHGGQGVPLVVATAVEEIWFGANVAFMLCPQLGRGAVEALTLAGSPALQQRFLPPMVSGEWTGTMNLTESQAGSDLAAIRTHATPQGDCYRLRGQKIFITFGEHDMAANIVHLVLARIDGAPAGVKGISLFVVPKFLGAAEAQAVGFTAPADANSTAGMVHNDVRCVSIEHKLGIHASPTCVMSYGDTQGAVGYLVGEPHHGLEYMFIMMNAARLSVGVQGIGLAERAWQQAADWARTRVQGKPVGSGATAGATIIDHPDVRRMLLRMKSSVEGMRALALYSAMQLDLARAQSAGDAGTARRLQTRGELLIPIVKGFCTEQVNVVASLAVQVHGGMGYIEETGVAQTLRDARITAIYEGTTGIQANDLLGRKLVRDGGAALRDLLQALNEMLASAPLGEAHAAALAMRAQAGESLRVLQDTAQALLQRAAQSPAEAYAVSVPFLELCGLTLGGALLVHGALLAQLSLQNGATDSAFMQGKLQTARFYVDHWLPQAMALAQIVTCGGASVMQARTELL